MISCCISMQTKLGSLSKKQEEWVILLIPYPFFPGYTTVRNGWRHRYPHFPQFHHKVRVLHTSLKFIVMSNIISSPYYRQLNELNKRKFYTWQTNMQTQGVCCTSMCIQGLSFSSISSGQKFSTCFSKRELCTIQGMVLDKTSCLTCKTYTRIPCHSASGESRCTSSQKFKSSR